MREILFRGKIESDWAYGDLKHFKDTVVIFEQGYTFPCIVIPETVGQFTGLTDKNGIKIFEGDIVQFKGANYEVVYIEKYTRFAGKKKGCVFSVFAWKMCEVIGNIHDNPELMRSE